MKLTNIAIQNVLGITTIEAALATPVTLFAGDNYAGKSSIREAVRAAFLGMPERVLKKKDFGQLVHDGQDAGSAAVDFEGGSAVFTAPKGEQELKHDFKMSQWDPMALALPYCLDAEAFARATGDERRQLLFSITGASAKGADIIAALKARGLDDKTIETVTPLLRSGFPAAAKFSEERCREAKGAWKAITGETYGHVKAEGWAAPVPEIVVDTATIEQMQTRVEILKGKIGAEQTRLGAAEQKLKAWLAHSENREADRKAFARLASLEKKLEHDNDELVKWQDQVKVLEGQAGTGPRVGEVHDLARAAFFLIGCVELDQFGAEPEFKDAQRALSTYEARYGSFEDTSDPEAAAKLPEARRAHDLMQRSVDNDRRDIEAAKTAGARLSATVEKGSEAEVESIETLLAGYQDELREAQAQLQALQADQHAADAAKANTEKAHAHHQTAQQWQVAIDALSPAGIPAEILGQALDPFNQTMLDLADTLGWPGVAIDCDMMITAGGRAYALLSESEKWRTNTIIALALASLSGLRLVALDRVDVLNLAGRGELIEGLDILADDGFFDTALLFGTFKKLPNFEKFPNVTGFWVEGGTIAQAEPVREAA